MFFVTKGLEEFTYRHIEVNLFLLIKSLNREDIKTQHHHLYRGEIPQLSKRTLNLFYTL